VAPDGAAAIDSGRLAGAIIDAGGAIAPASRPRRQTGALWVNLLPWARVTVDGRTVGDTPQRITLPAGRHRLVLFNPQLDLRRELVITVRAGKTTRVEKW
jgi:serine/threonine-protein kinase